jgi:hypothetical protein
MVVYLSITVNHDVASACGLPRLFTHYAKRYRRDHAPQAKHLAKGHKLEGCTLVADLGTDGDIGWATGHHVGGKFIDQFNEPVAIIFGPASVDGYLAQNHVNGFQPGDKVALGWHGVDGRDVQRADLFVSLDFTGTHQRADRRE